MASLRPGLNPAVYGQPKKQNTNLIIAAIVAAVVLIGGGITAIVLLNKDGSNPVSAGDSLYLEAELDSA